jgi:hypothetical protein
VNANWLRHRHGPSEQDGAERRDSAEYQRAHTEACALVAAYLRDIGAADGGDDDVDVLPASPIPSTRIALARRSAA